MQTLGIDFAASHKKTVVARVSWGTERATLQPLYLEATNETIINLIADPLIDKAGIDCPLGWPDGFLDFVVAHHEHRLLPGAGEDIAARDPLAYRRTDLVVRRSDLKLIPLSVSTDRIGRAAMRVAGLLSELDARGCTVDRAGRGKVVEVYPAAALKYWDLPYRSYKGASPTRGALISAFLTQTRDWLVISAEDKRACERSDDAFDAVIAALIARAASLPLGVTTPTSDEDWAAASREGWIAIPQLPLNALDPSRNE